jgi:hypothetical protein
MNAGNLGYVIKYKERNTCLPSNRFINKHNSVIYNKSKIIIIIQFTKIIKHTHIGLPVCFIKFYTI